MDLGARIFFTLYFFASDVGFYPRILFFLPCIKPGIVQRSALPTELRIAYQLNYHIPFQLSYHIPIIICYKLYLASG